MSRKSYVVELLETEHQEQKQTSSKRKSAKQTGEDRGVNKLKPRKIFFLMKNKSPFTSSTNTVSSQKKT